MVAGPVFTEHPCLLNTTAIRSGCKHDNSCCAQVRQIVTLFHKSVILQMTATRPPLAKVDLRRNKEGGNVKGRVVRIICIVDLGTRVHGEPGMKDAVSQDLGSSAVLRS